MSQIITAHELENRSLGELEALYRKVFDELVRSEPDSAERRNALASLENISRVLNKRRTSGSPSP